jgi:hypothetical protein
MANFVLGLQALESEPVADDTLGSGWTSFCCDCSWVSTTC